MSVDPEQTTAVRTIGRYRVFEELGRGAMGVVYRGFDPVIGRTVALKTILFAGAEGQAKEFRDRLYREAAAAGALSHPGIVTIFDIVEDPGMTAVAMEFIEGRNLASVIEERAPLPLDQAVDLFEQLSSALDYASANGIVHRDIKPANIIMTPAGRLKVTDFGVARLALSTMTLAGTVLGSPSYMSPEQVRGLPLDGRSDLFSATVVFYELLTRERPFAGSDVATTMYRIAHEPPTPPEQFNAAIGPELTAVLYRALAKDPNDRYPNGADLIAELRRAVAKAGTIPHHAHVTGAPAPIALDGADIPVPSEEAFLAAARDTQPPLAPLPGAPGPGPDLRPATARGQAAVSTAPQRPERRRHSGVMIGGVAAVAAVVVLAVAGTLMLRGTGADEGAGVQAVPEAAAPGSPPQASPVVPEPPPPTTETGAPRGRQAPMPRARASRPAASPKQPGRGTSGAGVASRPPQPAAPEVRPTTRPAPVGRVYEANQVDVRPTVTQEVAPAYPPDAASRGIEDVVILKVLVLSSGQVGDVRVLRGSAKDPAFDEAASAAVRQWTFQPARKSGQPVDSWFNVGVPFQMKR